MCVYACGIQMINKRLRIIFSVSPEEHARLKELAGIASLSAFIRSMVFGKINEEQRGTSLKEWVDLLSQIEPDFLKERLSDIRYSSKNGGRSVVDIIKRRLQM